VLNILHVIILIYDYARVIIRFEICVRLVDSCLIEIVNITVRYFRCGCRICLSTIETDLFWWTQTEVWYHITAAESDNQTPIHRTELPAYRGQGSGAALHWVKVAGNVARVRPLGSLTSKVRVKLLFQQDSYYEHRQSGCFQECQWPSSGRRQQHER